MPDLDALFRNNRQWAAAMERRQPGFFAELAQLQAPHYLWIGCSDSRVPANEIVGLQPGDLFVHRNVANLVIHTDLNCMAVIQYAIEVLGVRQIIVCGHYGCGGVTAAMQDSAQGLVEHWLGHLRDILRKHQGALDEIEDPAAKLRRCCELNVMEQVQNVCSSPLLRAAWQQGLDVSVHGVIYDIADGLLRDLQVSVSGPG